MSQWMRYHELSRSERKARERDSKMQAGFRGLTGRRRELRPAERFTRVLGGTSSKTLKSDLTKKTGARDNKLQAENELLREERESERLREDNERLRELLKSQAATEYIIELLKEIKQLSGEIERLRELLRHEIEK